MFLFIYYFFFLSITFLFSLHPFNSFFVTDFPATTRILYIFFLVYFLCRSYVIRRRCKLFNFSFYFTSFFFFYSLLRDLFLSLRFLSVVSTWSLLHPLHRCRCPFSTATTYLVIPRYVAQPAVATPSNASKAHSVVRAPSNGEGE